MAKPELQQQAQKLRRQGFSVKEIEKQLGVSRSTVSLWVRDVELTEVQKAHLAERQHAATAKKPGAEANAIRFRNLRRQYQEAGRIRAREGRFLHHAGCMLYWAEGEKSKNTLHFVNSDPNMLLLFMRFLREEMCVSNDEISLRIHCHTSDAMEMKRIERFWIELLGLSEENVKKTYTKRKGESTKRVLEYGVCGIKVHSTELVQHIYGAIQEYGGFENPDWLF